MGHVANKIPPHALQLVLLSHVLDKNEAIINAKARKLELQTKLGVWTRLDPKGLLKVFCTEILFQRLSGCKIRQQAPFLVVKTNIQQILCRVVAPHQATFRVNDQGRIPHGRKGLLDIGL